MLEAHGFDVAAAPQGAARPTGSEAAPDPVDAAAQLGAARLVVLDLESGGRALWVTQYLRGYAGPWAVGQVVCVRERQAADGRGERSARADAEPPAGSPAAAPGELHCPELERVLTAGLRPRKAGDVDIISLLRRQAPRVGKCIAAEDGVPAQDRIFGRVELELEAKPDGRVEVVTMAPAILARAQLGRCLRAAMESMTPGAFEGQPLRFRVPIDLD